ncbi:MAG: beta-glucosidase, partial [Anaerolineae bacterium]|nr:beta-glucosidase [Anaerolineae bacterium]
MHFPSDFVWGAATAAYQIEGGTTADGRGPSIWDTFTHTPGKVLNGDTGDKAADHYHRWREDIALMQTLNLAAYRFSIAWPRILPTGRGKINQAGLDWYSRLIDGLLAANITPYITLYHWDLPQALQDEDGWLRRGIADDFAAYTDIVSRAYGDRVKDWITLNEPWEHAALGHLLGEHAPGHHNPWTYLKVAHHQLLGHGLAVERIRAACPDARVGITLSLTPILPKTTSPQDVAAAKVADQFFNTFYLDGIYKGQYPDPFWSQVRWLHPQIGADDMQVISRPLDFLGVNFYSREFARAVWWMPFLRFWVDGDLSASGEKVVNGMPFTASGREVYPQGLYDLLMYLKREYNNPFLYLTENGAAFTDHLDGQRVHDEKRVAYLQGYMDAAARAIRDGTNLHGYFIWSLTDNFEWSLGYGTRFGIVYVDYPT